MPVKIIVESGHKNLDTCKYLCDKNYQCKAVEWYPSKVLGPCLHILSKDDVENVATQGSLNRRYKDAECYIKEATKTFVEYDEYTKYDNLCVN
jgi:hypothetical protein